MRFKNRVQAGRLLAGKLSEYGGRSDVVVLALPRGGVPVAFEVAQHLGAPLEFQTLAARDLLDEPARNAEQ